MSSIAGFLLVPPQMAWAHDAILASADVTTTGSYASNPFTEVGHNLGSAYVQVNAKPQVSWTNETNALTLTGLLNYAHYFRLYPDTDDYGVNLDYHGTPTARLTTNASVKYDSSIVGGYDAINPVTNPAAQQPPATTGPDLALYGSRQRRRSLDFAGDLGYAVSEHDSLTANAFYDVSRYGSLGSSNYDGYGGGFGYSRLVSEHLHLGVQASTARYVYQGPLGNTQVYSLQATVTDQFSSYWHVTGSLGVSYADRTIGGKTTSPTGTLQLCRTGELTSLCATVSQAILPTGVTGTVTSRSAGATYSRTLSELSSFSLSANYSHNGNASSPVLGNAYVYGTGSLSATANYDRTLRPRIHLVASTLFRKVTGGGYSRPADFGGSLGISVRFGRYR